MKITTYGPRSLPYDLTAQAVAAEGRRSTWRPGPPDRSTMRRSASTGTTWSTGSTCGWTWNAPEGDDQPRLPVRRHEPETVSPQR